MMAYGMLGFLLLFLHHFNLIVVQYEQGHAGCQRMMQFFSLGYHQLIVQGVKNHISDPGLGVQPVNK